MAKRLWIINQYAGGPDIGGEFRHYYLAKYLVEMGVEVWIVSGSQSHLHRNPPQFSNKHWLDKIDGINYCWIRTPAYKKSVGFGRVWNMFAFSRGIRNLQNILPTPSAILVSSPSLYPVKPAYAIAKAAGAKFIFEVRDIWPLSLVEITRLTAGNPLVKGMQRLEDFGYKVADHVVSLLPAAKSHMISRGMKVEKFIHIPNGIYIPEAENAEPLKEIEILPNKFCVGYVGSVGIPNALEYYVEAARLLQANTSIHFYLVGDGVAKRDMMKLAANLPNLTFIGPISRRQVPAFLELMDATYIGWHRQPLYRFGISANKLFDYLFAGKPIIHSVEAANDPVKESGAGISIQPEDPGQIAEAILKIFSMTAEERRAMGRTGKKYVLDYHSYESLARKYFQLLG